MNAGRWYAHLQVEVAALQRLAPGDEDAQRRAGKAAIQIFPDPATRATALRRFADNPAVVALGAEFCGVLQGAAQNGLVIS